MKTKHVVRYKNHGTEVLQDEQFMSWPILATLILAVIVIICKGA